ncbi:MAG: glycosyltransferase family 2 protein [Marinilabiliaceae bacterium]|nr:glycosyltransferase family 2 protein [Marinilabiliaceae bacterium]
MNIIAIVVTYNRCDLLRECLDAIQAMSDVKPSKVIVVNNASNDGTEAFLIQISKNPFFEIVTLEKNIGGAGGFAYGMRLAVQQGCDYVWLMDDDTIPQINSLAKLCEKVQINDNVGFVSSHVVWTNGADHIMNRPTQISQIDGPSGCQLLKSSSFVSIMVKSEVIKRIGLPYKEFFIWLDDSEYTQRIVKKGYKGLYATDSIVIHKTKENYGPTIAHAPVSTAWKFYYAQRNSIFMNRQKYGNMIVLVVKELNHLRLAFHNINKRPTSERAIFRKFILKGFRDGFSFKPQIEYVQ